MYRICGNRVGCDCCEKAAAKTACLVRYQQNFFYRGLLYAAGGIGTIAATYFFGGEDATPMQYVSVQIADRYPCTRRHRCSPAWVVARSASLESCFRALCT